MKVSKSHFKLYKLFILTINLLLVLSLSGCYFLPKEEDEIAPPLIKAPKVTFETVDVQSGTIEKDLTDAGKFVSISQTDLCFKYMSGNLKQFNVKVGDKVQKGDVLAQLDTDSLESQIRDQKINVQKSEILYNEEVANPKATSDSIELKKLDLDSAKNRLSDLQNQYNKATITAPESGIVAFVEKVNYGDYVAANKNLITIADPTKLQVEYTGGDSSSYKLQDTVNVKIGTQDYKGKVVMIPATVPVDADKNMKTSIRVSVENLPSSVSVGDQATITLVLAKSDNAIKIGKGLVNTVNGRNYVFVLDKGVKVERDVELGIDAGTDVEIKKGLSVGDKVIVR